MRLTYAERMAGRRAVLADKLADMTDRDLQAADAWDLVWRAGLTWADVERALIAEQLKRGLLTLADLTPPQRREHVTVDDLHAIAAGPMMEPGQLYLPAGRISLAEARLREQRTILSRRR